jgi:hypothetical protein
VQVHATSTTQALQGSLDGLKQDFSLDVGINVYNCSISPFKK